MTLHSLSLDLAIDVHTRTRRRRENMAKSASRRLLPERVWIKAAHLQKVEGKTREQALGAAAGMNRAGRLTEGGKYIRSRRK